MTVHAKKASLIRAILMAFTIFLLTGCRLEGTIDYRPDANTVLSFEVEDTTGYMTELKRTCESVKIMAQANARFIKNPKVENLTSPGGRTKCKVTSTEPMEGTTTLKKESGKYYINVPKWKINGDFSKFQLKMTIIMPGKVTQTNIGKVEGNKVIIEDPNVWFKGISIVSEKEKSPNTSNINNNPNITSNDSDESKPSQSESGNGFPAWGWGLVGGGVLAVIIGIWFLLGHRRRTAHAPTTGPSQAPVVPSTLAQHAQPYAPGQQATNPTHYPHNNAQAEPPSGYGYNAPPTTPQTPSPDHTNDPNTRYRPR